MFDRAFKRVNTFVDFRTELVEGKEKRAEEELIQESLKKQNMEDDKETIELKKLMEIIPDEEVAIDAIPLAIKSLRIIYMLVEKKYPLKPPTITDMLNKKLQGRIVGIKSLLNAASITAAHIRVNAAQLC
ncbi:hypothetical protein Tco_0798737 [Tanacetum coccineum]